MVVKIKRWNKARFPKRNIYSHNGRYFEEIKLTPGNLILDCDNELVTLINSLLNTYRRLGGKLWYRLPEGIQLGKYEVGGKK